MPIVTFAAKFDFLDEIREFVAGIAREAGFTEKEVYSIQLATDEAASNIIEHAYQGVKNGQIEISCKFQNSSLTITLRDWGKLFDPSKVAQPNLKADLSDRKIGGLGIYLMRKLMDEVRYESSPISGNVLTLVKRKG